MAASATKSAKLADWPEGWATMPLVTEISLPSTFQRLAAAATNMARVAAPTVRS